MAEAMAWVGRSDNISVPILNAEFWTEGREVVGVLEATRQIEGRENMKPATGYRLRLETPVQIDGADEECVELVSSLAGIKYALQDLRIKGYTSIKTGDRWFVQCTGIKKAKREGFNDSPEFEIGVKRDVAVSVAPAKVAAA